MLPILQPGCFLQVEGPRSLPGGVRPLNALEPDKVNYFIRLMAYSRSGDSRKCLAVIGLFRA